MELGGNAFQFRVADGVRLSGRDYHADPSAVRTVVCLPGFSRSVRDFDAIARHLSEGDRPFRVLSFDYRGRGASDHADPSTYTPQAEAADVLAGMSARGVSHAAFVGTSRGGIVAMTIAALRPGVIRCVVLNDVGPVIDVAYLAGIKDHIAGKHLPPDWDTAAASLKTAYSSTFTGLSDTDWTRFARQIYVDDAGRPALGFDTGLARSLETVTAETPPVDIWPQFLGLSDVPVLVLRGANSTLLKRDTLHAMMARHPSCEAFVVPGEGHAPLLWDGSTQDRIARFLERNA